jgi:hypothetical protein
MARGKASRASALPAVLVSLLLLAGRGLADGKKLEVVAERANIFLEASERSPVVETLGPGSILSLACTQKTRLYWYYVYFVSQRTGRTRAGYVHESLVRPLFPLLRVINISSDDEILNPREIRPESGELLNIEWGASRETIIKREGKPLSTESAGGLEVLRYKREIMNKTWQVEYILGAEGLLSTRYRLLENYTDKSRYIEDYEKLRAYLTEKVGRPRSDRVVNNDPAYNNGYNNVGDSLSKGLVAYSSEWVFSDKSVRLKLEGAGNRVALAAEVQDVKAKSPTS